MKSSEHRRWEAVQSSLMRPRRKPSEMGDSARNQIRFGDGAAQGVSPKMSGDSVTRRSKIHEGYAPSSRLVGTSILGETAVSIAFQQTALGLQGESPVVTNAPQVLNDAMEAAKTKGRSARFAIRVVAEYRYTCALTGYRCMTADGLAIVDAAHVEAWSETQNDDLTNGLALSKNAHWMFDEGLWSVDDDLRVVVNARRFDERGPDGLKLASFAGRHLQFDPATKLRPALEHLRRHRKYFTAGL